MKTLLIQIGKTVDKNYIDGIKDYVSRISHYMPFDILTIEGIKATKNMTEENQKLIEGELILKHIHVTDKVVLLDERGKEYTSIDFAQWLEKQRNISRRLVFVIGGPYGFSKQIYARADGMITLSKMTFSHQMIRLIFVEQLYRACTIIKGEPYHHK